MTSPQDSLKKRMRFLGLDESVKPILNQFHSRLAENIDEILDSFYEKVLAWPELAQKVETHASVDRLKAAQTSHWASVFSGDFNQDYYDRAVRVGEAHERIGLDPHWYIGGYAHVADRIIRMVLKDDQERAAELSAVLRSLLLDMDLAISVYIDAGEKKLQTELNRIADEIETQVGLSTSHVVEQIRTMGDISRRMEGATDTLRMKSSSVASASEQTSVNVEAVSAAVEEMSASVHEIGRQVTQTTSITRRAVDEAHKANQVVEGLATYAGEIDAIVKMISNIASQTNLLALNATIEAARAGSYGKGFSVVASEVKALANQTAAATKTIGDQIEKITSSVKEAVTAIGAINSVIDEAENVSTATAGAVEQQTAATSEISANIQQAALGTRDVSADIGVVASEAEGLSETSATVQAASNELATIAGALQQKLAVLVSSLRQRHLDKEEHIRKTA